MSPSPISTSLEGQTARPSASDFTPISDAEKQNHPFPPVQPDQNDEEALGGYGADEKPNEPDEPHEEYEDDVRHSYEYTRGRDEPRPPPLGRHTSALQTMSSIRSRKSQTREGFGHPLAHEKTGKDYLVEFDGKDDPYKPLNWPWRKKAMTTVMYGLTTAGITFASSVYSAAITDVSTEFQVGTEVASLGISMMLFGFGLGPLFWAPLSELYGRKTAVLTPYFISAMFSFASGASKDIQSLLITRFFAGFFGSAPITNTGGVLGDIWTPQQRGMAMVAYAMAVTGGPTLGPIVGNAIVTSYLGWRWTEYITGIIQCLMLVLDVLLLDESFNPILLTYKARRLRHETGNWALHAEHEEWDVSVRALAHKYMVRPFQLLFTPICFMVALYASFVYAILYANLSAFPVEFQEVRGWHPVVASLPFLALLLGIIVGGVANVFNNKYYFKRFQANNNRPVPEARLPPMMAGSIFFAGGLFLFAWTSSPHIHWICSCIGIFFLGVGFFTIFQASLNYLVDTFTKFGASAIAANTFLRSMLAGAFPLFITQELHAIGVDWGMTVFACFAVVLIPVPFLFFFYGKRIRARGKWSQGSL